MIDNNFIGRNGFLWFTGVVEDRLDPLKAGRVKVRAVGFHTSNKEKLPTSDLPWAICVLPTTAPGISGLGSSPSFLVEGSWVWGYFRDGEDAQEPVILGSLPGRPSEYGNPNKGFYDPNARENDTTKSVYPREIDEPDVNRLAVNDPNKQHSSLTTRTAQRLTNIQGVNNTWNQPEISYNAVYPYNHVYESESGHIMEFDDTTDAKRIHLRHTSGTSIEMTDNGDTVEITKNNRYILVTADNKVYIKGTKDVVIDGDYDLKVNGNYNISVAGNKTETISGSKTSNTTGAVVHRGSTIDLNP
jgi:hypothetical protein